MIASELLEYPMVTGLYTGLCIRLERGPGIALQAMQEKKALISRWQGRMVGFLKLRRQCGVSHQVQQGAQGDSHSEEIIFFTKKVLVIILAVFITYIKYYTDWSLPEKIMIQLHI